MLFIRTKTHTLQIFGGNPLCQDTKRSTLLLDETLKSKNLSQGPLGWGLGPGGEYRVVGVCGEGGEGYYQKGSYAGLATPGELAESC